SLLFSFSSYVAHRDLSSFPTRRSSDLEKLPSLVEDENLERRADGRVIDDRTGSMKDVEEQRLDELRIFVHALEEYPQLIQALLLDRKSTRLNSSHLVISYAVFCLKKKK